MAKGLADAKKKEWEVKPVEGFKYLNCTKASVQWDQFPCDYATLSQAMDCIPNLSGKQEQVWKVLLAVLHLGNAEFKGATDEADAEFVDAGSISMAAKLLGCEPAQLIKAICAQMIKAGSDWISKPNTTSYAVNVKNALSKALYSKLFDFVCEATSAPLIPP